MPWPSRDDAGPGTSSALVRSPAVEAGPVEPEVIEGFYGEFSLRVGLQDWRVANARHEQLKLLVTDALGRRRRDARILDVGCGTGVMTSFMTRFGTATGIDYSESALRLAAAMVPHASFRAGSVTDAGLPPGGFDVITLFDVLEHVPRLERRRFAVELGRLLARGGTLIASTPHPRLTEWMHAERPELLQVVDETVELRDLIELFGPLDLTLTHYETYDIERTGPQYQFVVFEQGIRDRAAPMPDPRLARRLRLVDNRIARRVRPWLMAADLARRGQVRWAFDVLRSQPFVRR
jgi:SAM-dependent methyltransferase